MPDQSTKRLKILISAYACEPHGGSESDVGWNVVKAVSQYHDVWVLTREDRRNKIEPELQQHSLPNVHWIFYDLPYWMRFWRQGRRGQRLHYYMWQAAVYPIAKKTHQEIDFDVIHHVTYVKYWNPSFVSRLSAPFLWGPVGGGESIPDQLYQTLDKSWRIYENLRDFLRKVGHLDPFVRMTARNADLCLATTGETADQVKKLGAKRVQVTPAIALSLTEIELLNSLPAKSPDEPFRLLSLGRLLALKGFHLGLQGFKKFREQFPDSEYWIIGDGPQRQHLEKLVQELGVQDSVRFWGKLPRQESLERLGHCDVLVHPSMHDSGGLVCLEAMAAGRPVICLNTAGPGLIVADDTGIKVAPASPQAVVDDMATAMSTLANDAALRQKLGEAGRKRVSEQFSWDKKGEALANLYHTLIENGTQ